MDEERYGIAELAEAADVSVRTVRYYIAEGLLPPPVTAGARSYYTAEHLARLRLIGRLKDAFLPLREIRRHLSALDEETIRELAEAEAEAEAARVEADAVADELLAEEELRGPGAVPWDPHAIADMIRESFPPGFPFHDQSGRREQKQRERTVRHEHRARSEPRGAESASDYIAMVLGTVDKARRAAGSSAPLEVPPAPPRPPSAPGPATEQAPPREKAGQPTETLWRHIRISDDAQLLIREEAFGRRLEKIEWLIGWAKKVLG